MGRVLRKFLCVFVLVVCTAPAEASPAVHVKNPTFSFPDAPSVRIEGLPPMLRVQVRMTALTGPVPVSSEAQLVTRADGQLSLGSRRVESLMWNVEPDKEADPAALEAYDNGQWSQRSREWRLTVSAAGKPLAATVLVQRLLPSTATVRPIAEGGLKGALFVPSRRRSRGCLLVIGGSDGGMGWQGTMARALANEGYCAFALAYFGEEGLPQSLSRIPLEYFSRALDWLSRQPGIDRHRLGVIGYSKGGEAALLLASVDPSVSLTAAMVPSGYVFQAIGRGAPKSSWTLNAVDVPFVPYDPDSRWSQEGKPLAKLYEDSIRTQADKLTAATIPVEKIRGPVALFSGSGDWSWPSARLSDEVMNRLDRFGFKWPHRHYAYADAGHSLAYPDFWVPVSVMPKGASETAEATAAARKRAWVELRKFLGGNL